MDKKKVKELIQEAIIWSKQANQHSVVSNLEEALKELSKSDWVSVEEGLPEYNKMVWVRSKENTQLIWSAYRTKSKTHEVDENSFIKPAVLEISITHWKPIEKLEE